MRRRGLATARRAAVELNVPEHAAAHEKHVTVDSTKHAANVIWEVEANPHKTGDRNAWWMAFKGVDPKDEL